MRLLHCWLVAMMVVLLGAACTSVDRIETSPLATWDPSTAGVFNNPTPGEGTLDISAGCVRLILDNQKTVLLVWQEPTS